MKPYGRVRRQSSHSHHDAKCQICYPDISKREGRRKAREDGKKKCMNDHELSIEEHYAEMRRISEIGLPKWEDKARNILKMARADLYFAVDLGKMPGPYCRRLSGTAESITEILDDHDEFAKLFARWEEEKQQDEASASS